MAKDMAYEKAGHARQTMRRKWHTRKRDLFTAAMLAMRKLVRPKTLFTRKASNTKDIAYEKVQNAKDFA